MTAAAHPLRDVGTFSSWLAFSAACEAGRGPSPAKLAVLPRQSVYGRAADEKTGRWAENQNSYTNVEEDLDMVEKLLSSNERRVDLLGCMGVGLVMMPAARSGGRKYSL